MIQRLFVSSTGAHVAAGDRGARGDDERHDNPGQLEAAIAIVRRGTGESLDPVRAGDDASSDATHESAATP